MPQKTEFFADFAGLRTRRELHVSRFASAKPTTDLAARVQQTRVLLKAWIILSCLFFVVRARGGVLRALTPILYSRDARCAKGVSRCLR
jgi:hypothetical protein